jgi:hypothetical protein
MWQTVQECSDLGVPAWELAISRRKRKGITGRIHI